MGCSESRGGNRLAESKVALKFRALRLLEFWTRVSAHCTSRGACLAWISTRQEKRYQPQRKKAKPKVHTRESITRLCLSFLAHLHASTDKRLKVDSPSQALVRLLLSTFSRAGELSGSKILKQKSESQHPHKKVTEGTCNYAFWSRWANGRKPVPRTGGVENRTLTLKVAPSSQQAGIGLTPAPATFTFRLIVKNETRKSLTSDTLIRVPCITSAYGFTASRIQTAPAPANLLARPLCECPAPDPESRF